MIFFAVDVRLPVLQQQQNEKSIVSDEYRSALSGLVLQRTGEAL